MEEPPVITARILHEANPAMFIDDNTIQTSSGGDSAMVQQMMTMITENYLALVTMTRDEKKQIQAMLGPPSPAVSRRFIRIDFQAQVTEKETALHKAMDDLLLD